MMLIGEQHVETGILARYQEIDKAPHEAADIAVDVLEIGRQAEMAELHQSTPWLRQHHYATAGAGAAVFCESRSRGTNSIVMTPRIRMPAIASSGTEKPPVASRSVPTMIGERLEPAIATVLRKARPG